MTPTQRQCAGWSGAQPEWAGILEDYIIYLAGQNAVEPESAEEIPDVRVVPARLKERITTFLGRYFGGLSEEGRDRIILYLTVGSTNMDYRSMVMNGEVQVVLAGTKSLVAMIDFILLAGLCEWPETTEELDKLLAPPGWFNRSMASFIKVAL